jgi:hypothetical protein
MLTEDPDGPWQKYTVQNARQFQSMDKRSALIGKPEQMTGAFRAELVTFKIPAGSRYLFPKRAFHRSTTKGLVVSLITKRNQESDPAVLLVPRPYSAEPTHGFANSWSEDRFVPFLRDAVDCLLS